jgi:hypothetical protein
MKVCVGNCVTIDTVPFERLGSEVVTCLVMEAEGSCECRLRNSEEAQVGNNLSLAKSEREVRGRAGSW